jgi:hypothetical protein
VRLRGQPGVARRPTSGARCCGRSSFRMSGALDVRGGLALPARKRDLQDSWITGMVGVLEYVANIFHRQGGHVAAWS